MTFDDAAHHLELKQDRIEVARPMTDVYMASCSPQGAQAVNHKKYNGFYKKRKKVGKAPKKAKFNHHGKGKYPFKKNKSKLKYYNCGKKDHFARECTKPKKVKTLDDKINIVYVSSYVYLINSHSLWIVDLATINHIARDKDAFLEYCWIPYGNRWIYVENNTRINVKEVGTCKLNIHSG